MRQAAMAHAAARRLNGSTGMAGGKDYSGGAPPSPGVTNPILAQLQARAGGGGGMGVPGAQMPTQMPGMGSRAANPISGPGMSPDMMQQLMQLMQQSGAR